MSTLWLDALGAELKFYDARGTRTRCLEAGSGTAVIFLHGVGGHCEAFARNVGPIAAAGYRAISLDYLGFGLTEPRGDTPPAAKDYVAHLIDFMDAAGVDQAVLVGESLGGWVSFWTALMHPERVLSLVSVCGALLDVETSQASLDHAAHGHAGLRELTQRFVEDPTRENIKARLYWLFKNPERDVTEELVDLRWALYRRQDGLKNLQKTAPGGPNLDSKLGPAELAAIAHPTLMLWTSDNPTTTAETARNATEFLPNGEFYLMEDCAHWPQWEDPETFNDTVISFLRNHE